MKTSGFTLVEVIGILVIITIISLITIPLVGNTITRSKNEVNDTQIKLLELAAGNYATDHLSEFENNQLIVPISKLQEKGYINYNILLEGIKSITIIKKNNSLEYQFNY